MLVTILPRPAFVLTSSVFILGCVFATTWIGCAKVTSNVGPGGGTGGTSPGGQAPIPNLASLMVSPPATPVTLTKNAAGQLSATAVFTAQGTLNDGSTSDVTSKVNWSLDPLTGSISSGNVTVTSPGIYTVTASSGSIQASAKLTASFSGTFMTGSFIPADVPKFEGSPLGSQVSIAYPLEGAVFPSNFGSVTVQVSKPASQDIARLTWTGDGLNVTYFGQCEAGPGSGCYVSVPADVTGLFLAASATNNVKLTVRLVSSAGGGLVESNTIGVAWANVPLSGGRYYWTTIQPNVVAGYHLPAMATVGTGIQRYNLDKNMAAPELVYTDQGIGPNFYGSPPAQKDGAQCVGCHALTNDGKTMALTVGGSSASEFALLDIATRTLTPFDPAAAGGSTSPMDINYYKQFRKPMFATETTFGPKGDVMVNMLNSQFTLHGVNVSLPAQGAVAPSWTEYKTDPFWSSTGKYFVFASFAAPNMGLYNPTGLNGDMKQGAQIVIADATETSVTDNAKVLVRRQAGVTSYYPAISTDDALVVYDQSTCGNGGVDVDKLATDYGNGTCDGYDDSSAMLWLTSPGGATPVRLDKANGGTGNDNSWPRWSPNIGTFRGQKLYWLAFSSRRPYGLQVNSGKAPADTKPQLWFAAVVTGGEFTGDPSYAPVWLPNQNPIQALPNGNHVPQWVKVAVTIE